MLEPWMIERLREEQERRRERERTPLRIPAPEPSQPRDEAVRDSERGVVTVDFQL